ncbi:tail fiber domain-containing protein [Candidatus Gracilibacteria bacterium]|nr:tail fiber domain-containing protein [Candidatus Gracilibacteria bacterium]
MKKNTIKNGIIFGLSASLTMILVGISYAAWNDMINSGDPLTANNWNSLVSRISELDFFGNNSGIARVTSNFRVENISNLSHSTIYLGPEANDAIITDTTGNYNNGYFFRVHDESQTYDYRDVLAFSENGNVGIGIVRPDTRLHITGGTTRFTTVAPSHTSNPGKEIDVNGRTLQSYVSPSAAANFFWGGNNQSYIQFRNTSNNSIGSIAFNGTSGVNYNTSSDARLKENITKVKSALDALKKIGVYNFNYKNENEKIDGFLAQELEDILPYAVTGSQYSDEYDQNDTYPQNPLQVDYSKIVPILTAALQELEERNATLEERIKKLESTQ